MRIVLEIIGIVLLVNGVGGLLVDDFGLVTSVAEGGVLTALQVTAAVLGGVLAGGSFLARGPDEAGRS